MSKLSFRAALLCVAFTSAHTLRAATPEAALEAALLPGAGVFIQADYAAIEASPFLRQIIEKGRQLAGGQLEGQAARLAPMLGLFAKAGFVGNLAQGAASFSGLPLLGFTDFDFIEVATFQKPITPDNLRQLVEGIFKLVNDLGVPEVNEFVTERVRIIGFSHGGANGLSFTLKILDDEDDPTLTLALSADGRALFIGPRDTVQAAIDRANAGAKAAPSANLKRMLDGAPAAKDGVRFAFAIPKLARYFMTELDRYGQFSDAPTGSEPYVNALVNAAKGLQGASVAVSFKDDMALSVSVLLNTPARAAEFREFLDINVLGMAKMGLYQATGQNTPFAESLVAAANGGVVTLRATITLDDIALFEKMAE